MWVSYENGNYKVMLNTINGTKIRFNKEDIFKANRPESIDVKISNMCHHNCLFCHENSSADGYVANISNVIYFAKGLPPYTELAIGGGNLMDNIKHTEQILNIFKEHKAFCSITIQLSDFIEYFDIIKRWKDSKLVYGIGISYNGGILTNNFWAKYNQISNAVLHVIAGILSPRDFDLLTDYAKKEKIKVLILGYKKMRRGDKYYSSFETKIESYMYYMQIHLNEWLQCMSVCSFDNLALQQLHIKEQISKDKWDMYYMGEDGSATFYVDLVEMEYAKSSTSLYRYVIRNNNIIDMFNIIRKEEEKYDYNSI